MKRGCVPGFVPSRHGLPFPNCWPDGQPVFRVPTPFGTWDVGNARAGVCGGMVYAVIDLFHFGRPVPAAPTDEVFAYCARRLLASWDLPFGWGRYYDWQTRPDASAVVAGVRLRAGTGYLTAVEEWPRIKHELDAGRLAPLGLVNERTANPLALGRNHQVLAYGYEATDRDVRLKLYDPNYPLDDHCEVRIDLADPDAGRRLDHSRTGGTVRGVFLTEYRRPAGPPAWAGPG